MKLFIKIKAKVFKRIILTTFLLFMSGYPLFAHPHVFMDTRVDFQFNKNGLEGFWVEWIFDEIFSATMKLDFDADRNNQFSRKEVKELENGAFSNLKHYNYFTYATKGKKKQAIKQVTSFSAEMRKNRLVYRFFVPHIVKTSDKEETFRVSVFDKDFYCDIAFLKEKPVVMKNSDAYKVSYRVQQNKKEVIKYNNKVQTAVREGASYSGETNPYEILLKFKRKP